MSTPSKSSEYSPYLSAYPAAGGSTEPAIGIPTAAPYVAGDSHRVGGAPAPPPGTGEAHAANWQQPAPPSGATYESSVVLGGQAPVAGGPPQYVQTEPGYVQTQPVKGNFFDKVVAQSKIALGQAENVARKAAGHVNAGGTTGSSLSTVWGKLESGAKQLIKGGQEPFWRDIFNPPPGEVLAGVYATHFSTERGPVAGNLFVTNENASFCSDRALEYQSTPGVLQKAYYKVVIPLQRASNVEVLPNPQKPKDQYVKLSTNDGHQFWFLAFFDLHKAVEALQLAIASARSRQDMPGSGIQSGVGSGVNTSSGKGSEMNTSTGMGSGMNTSTSSGPTSMGSASRSATGATTTPAVLREEQPGQRM